MVRGEGWRLEVGSYWLGSGILDWSCRYINGFGAREG